MGGPLLATLAELYVQHFEETYIMNDTNPHLSKIKMYARYVDDIFVIVKGNPRQASIILNHLNKIKPKIQFKLETENNKSINFLDVTITKYHDKNPTIGIYRKPTQTDLVIPAESNHPYNYKMAAFRSYVYRLLNYNLSREEYNKEKHILEDIALNNGYNKSVIDKTIERMNRTQEKTTENTTNTYIPIKYIDKTSQKIGNIFSKAGFKPAYKVKTNPIPLYDSTKQTNTTEQEKGVYQISCSEPSCQMTYIGYTNRNFRTRFKEHDRARYNKPDSMVAIHLKNNPTHTITYPDSLKILMKTNHKPTAQAYESYCIYKQSTTNQNKLLNKKEDVRNSVIYKTILTIENLPGKSRPGLDFPNTTMDTSQHPQPQPEPPTPASVAAVTAPRSHPPDS